MDDQAARKAFDQVIAQAGTIILGKEQQIRLALSCVLAGGHLLIEDIPGVGKTTLAHVIAKSLGLQFQRIQFTSDLLPSDIVGASIYNREAGTFQFIRGPLFAQLVLADEVNRTTPKTQSALLEAMEESQVTVEGQTYPLPAPFFVIATQNPLYQIGTFALPESQLDRFLMRLEMGYPNHEAERALLKGNDRKSLVSAMTPTMSPAELQAWQREVAGVFVSDSLLDYVQAILAFTRAAPYFQNGLSPRAGLGLLRAAQAWALLAGKRVVTPEDVQAVLLPVIGHRLQVSGEFREQNKATLLAKVRDVPIP